MADIFISYSRKDSAFGRRLHTKLTGEKHDIWMDWEDIPASVEWWSRIRDGILAADNFVLIISPHSIASPVCNLEVAYARELNKRILPILYRDVDEKRAFVDLVTQPLSDFQQALIHEQDLLAIARDNWNVLAGLNWITFTDETRFQEQYQELLQAVATDFAYVDEHTRLLVRANDWVKRKRSPDLLLRGSELLAAEAWLARAGDKNPQPALLQQELIAESRRAHNEEQRRIRRLRQAAAIFGGLVLLALIATGIAMTQAARAATELSVLNLDRLRAQTLVPGIGVVPPRTGTFSSAEFIATVTQIAQLDQWTPVAQEFAGVEMVQVPAGCFFMGNGLEDDERPVHEVCFTESFWIDRYEVTNQQFEQLGGQADHPPDWTRPNQPRTSITWLEAWDFCARRDARLPTERQWEYAARGPDSLVYPWGNELVPDNAQYNGEFVSLDPDFYPPTPPDEPADVGSRPAGQSWAGADDLSGNVWEWVSSIYSGEYLISYPDHLDIEPETMRRGRLVLRGGSWSSGSASLRGAGRASESPFYGDNTIGFRCAVAD